MAKLSSTMENYLEIILVQEKNHGHAHIKDIAQEIKIKMPSVTEAIKKLKVLDLVNYQKYGPVTLTKKGRTLAKNIFERHNTLFHFLNSFLRVDKKTAEIDACKIEHSLSDKTIAKIKSFMKKENKWN